MKAKIVAIVLLSAVLTVGSVQQALASDYLDEDDVYTMCEELCRPHQISPELVQAIIWRESRYDADAKNGNCKGLMQINHPCHMERMERLDVDDLYNYYDNIKVGVDYLADLFEEYEDASLVLDIYSGNSDAFKLYKKGKQSPYAKAILSLSKELEEKHGK